MRTLEPRRSLSRVNSPRGLPRMCAAGLLLMIGCSSQAEPAASEGPKPTDECTPPEPTDPSTCDLPPPAIIDADPGDPRGAVELDAEAGFIEVDGASCGSPRARLFYSFRPADEAPGTKPLLVLFNGGPGYPTSLGLLAYGTGPKTLRIPASGAPEAATFEDNPSSMTRFANLLYIDERDTGYSYLLGSPPSPPSPADCPEEDFVARDAADFVRVLLRFLEAHPPLLAQPVVLVGESYGALRALSMLERILHHAEDDDELATEVRLHLERAFPAHTGIFLPRDVARQFGHLVSIQGALVSDVHLQACPPPPEGHDHYNSSKPDGWSTAVSERALRLHAESADTAELFGVHPRDVVGLSPHDRKGGFRSITDPLDEDPLEDSLRERLAAQAVHEGLSQELGELAADDAYFRFGSHSAWTFEGDEPLMRVQPYVHVFATRAVFDHAICLDPLLEASSMVLRTDLDEGAQRPGRAWPRDPGRVCGCSSSPLRVATYEAGHELTVTHGAEFTEDVEAWLRQPTVTTPR